LTVNKLDIVIIQANLIWENPSINRSHFVKAIDTLKKKPDVIILPEMFTSGFSMNANKFAETMDGETINWLKETASNHNLAIAGSLAIKEGSQFYNRFVFVEPSGKISHYDKRHTFTLAKEGEVFTSGNNKIIIDYKDWRICPMICYDLRFPVWARNTEDYDVLIYVANWPKPRISAWDALLKARAIENMCYCIGVNRVGADAKGYEYPGHSTVYDVLGNRMTNLMVNKEAIHTITLYKKPLQKYRKALGFLNDRDTFNLE